MSILCLELFVNISTPFAKKQKASPKVLSNEALVSGSWLNKTSVVRV
jgi:hypothetical protein